MDKCVTSKMLQKGTPFPELQRAKSTVRLAQTSDVSASNSINECTLSDFSTRLKEIETEIDNQSMVSSLGSPSWTSKSEVTSSSALSEVTSKVKLMKSELKERLAIFEIDPLKFCTAVLLYTLPGDITPKFA